jgi:hypothetical protein
MRVVLMDETRRTRFCEVEHDLEDVIVLVAGGFAYTFERRAPQADGTPTYYLVDANVEEPKP